MESGQAVWYWDKILLVELETLHEMDPLVCGSVERCGEGARGGTGEGCVLGGNGLACFMFTYLPRENIKIIPYCLKATCTYANNTCTHTHTHTHTHTLTLPVQECS